MFGRRNPLTPLKRVALVLWPGSWHRQGLYVAHRLKRLPGTPGRIAAGFACGIAMSFTPFVGFHFILAALLALIIRGNFIASAVGTAAGNPWTFPFIWFWIYEFGRWILGIENGSAVIAEGDGFSALFGELLKSFWTLALEGRLPEGMTTSYLGENLLNVFWPMVVGGVPTAFLSWFLVFFPIRAMVRRYQFRRRRSMLRRLRRKRFRDRLKKGMTRESELDETEADAPEDVTTVTGPGLEKPMDEIAMESSAIPRVERSEG